jgi:hypothetical protein
MSSGQHESGAISMKYGIVFFLTILFGIAACSTHQGITPVQPEVGHYSPTVVESLYPTFRWQPLGEPETQYDLAIFEVPASGQPGKSIYYREGLKETQHKTEESLKPNTNYYWSVRSRRGDSVSDWSTYDHKLLVPIPFGFYYQGQGHLLFP